MPETISEAVFDGSSHVSSAPRIARSEDDANQSTLCVVVIVDFSAGAYLRDVARRPVDALAASGSRVVFGDCTFVFQNGLPVPGCIEMFSAVLAAH